MLSLFFFFVFFSYVCNALDIWWPWFVLGTAKLPIRQDCGKTDLPSAFSQSACVYVVVSPTRVVKK